MGKKGEKTLEKSDELTTSISNPDHGSRRVGRKDRNRGLKGRGKWSIPKTLGDECTAVKKGEKLEVDQFICMKDETLWGKKTNLLNAQDGGKKDRGGLRNRS